MACRSLASQYLADRTGRSDDQRFGCESRVSWTSAILVAAPAEAALVLRPFDSWSRRVFLVPGVFGLPHLPAFPGRDFGTVDVSYRACSAAIPFSRAVGSPSGQLLAELSVDSGRFGRVARVELLPATPFGQRLFGLERGGQRLAKR